MLFHDKYTEGKEADNAHCFDGKAKQSLYGAASMTYEDYTLQRKNKGLHLQLERDQ